MIQFLFETFWKSRNMIERRVEWRCDILINQRQDVCYLEGFGSISKLMNPDIFRIFYFEKSDTLLISL